MNVMNALTVSRVRALLLGLTVFVAAGACDSARMDNSEMSRLWDPPPLASANGKYSLLLRTLQVSSDRATHGNFKELGYQTRNEYSGYTGLPVGYWVYLYPDWYIWAYQSGVPAGAARPAPVPVPKGPSAPKPVIRDTEPSGKPNYQGPVGEEMERF